MEQSDWLYALADRLISPVLRPRTQRLGIWVFRIEQLLFFLHFQDIFMGDDFC